MSYTFSKPKNTRVEVEGMDETVCLSALTLAAIVSMHLTSLVPAVVIEHYCKGPII